MLTGQPVGHHYIWHPKEKGKTPSPSQWQNRSHNWLINIVDLASDCLSHYSPSIQWQQINTMALQMWGVVECAFVAQTMWNRSSEWCASVWIFISVIFATFKRFSSFFWGRQAKSIRCSPATTSNHLEQTKGNITQRIAITHPMLQSTNVWLIFSINWYWNGFFADGMY